MYFVVELMILMGYLMDNKSGMILSFLLYISIFLKKKYTYLEKLLIALIFSLPTFNVGFMGESQHHVFSWTVIFIAFLLLYLIYNYFKKKVKISLYKVLISLIMLGIIFINCFFEVNVSYAIFKWCQICIMLLPLLMVYDQRNYLMERITHDNGHFVSFINTSILATAMGLFLQYILYERLSIIVGHWTFYHNRTVVDFIFNGYSVLSLFLSLGVIINVKRFYKKSNLRELINIIICTAAIVINSSRTGMAVAITISIMIVLMEGLKTKKNLIITILVIPILIITLFFASDLQIQNREIQGMFDDNGRMQTYNYGIRVLTTNYKSFLFGSGIATENYTETIPHNFILETLVGTGIVVTSIIIMLVIALLKYINKYEDKYIIYGIFLGSMFITNFPGNMFATVYIILSILIRAKEERKGDIE